MNCKINIYIHISYYNYIYIYIHVFCLNTVFDLYWTCWTQQFHFWFVIRSEWMEVEGWVKEDKHYVRWREDVGSFKCYTALSDPHHRYHPGSDFVDFQLRNELNEYIYEGLRGYTVKKIPAGKDPGIHLPKEAKSIADTRIPNSSSRSSVSKYSIHLSTTKRHGSQDPKKLLTRPRLFFLFWGAGLRLSSKD